jgi:cold-inducible RNA-binding protein
MVVIGTRLHVSNIAPDVHEDDLRSLFDADGRRVAEVTIVTDGESGQSRGYGVVRMGSVRDALAAIAALDGLEVDGQALQVSQVRERFPG